MRRTRIILINDIDGTNADRTIQFGADGTTYEIALNATNAQKLDSALTLFSHKAPKVCGHRGTGQTRCSVASRCFYPEDRAWLKVHGITFPDCGRVPATVAEQYRATHP